MVLFGWGMLLSEIQAVAVAVCLPVVFWLFDGEFVCVGSNIALLWLVGFADGLLADVVVPGLVLVIIIVGFSFIFPGISNTLSSLSPGRYSYRCRSLS